MRIMQLIIGCALLGALVTASAMEGHEIKRMQPADSAAAESAQMRMRLEHERFQRYDLNRDGVVSPAEFASFQPEPQESPWPYPRR